MVKIMDIQAIITNLIETLSDFGLKILGAIAFWLIGRWLINLAVKLMKKALRGQSVDATLTV